MPSSSFIGDGVTASFRIHEAVSGTGDITGATVNGSGATVSSVVGGDLVTLSAVPAKGAAVVVNFNSVQSRGGAGDRQPAVAPIGAPSITGYNSGTRVLSGRAPAGNNVGVAIYVDGALNGLAVVTGGAFTYTVPAAVSAGSHTFSVAVFQFAVGRDAPALTATV